MSNNYNLILQSNNTTLGSNNLDLQSLIDKANALPDAGGASNDIVYVRVKAESPVAGANICYTAPDGNVRAITTDNLEGESQEFEAAAGSAIYINSFAYLTSSDFRTSISNGTNIHFFFVQEALGPDDYHEIIFDEL